jgi:hypothetical protein
MYCTIRNDHIIWQCRHDLIALLFTIYLNTAIDSFLVVAFIKERFSVRRRKVDPKRLHLRTEIEGLIKSAHNEDELLKQVKLKLPRSLHHGCVKVS